MSSKLHFSSTNSSLFSNQSTYSSRHSISTSISKESQSSPYHSSLPSHQSTTSHPSTYTDYASDSDIEPTAPTRKRPDNHINIQHSLIRAFGISNTQFHIVALYGVIVILLVMVMGLLTIINSGGEGTGFFKERGSQGGEVGVYAKGIPGKVRAGMGLVGGGGGGGKRIGGVLGKRDMDVDENDEKEKGSTDVVVGRNREVYKLFTV